MLNSLKLFLKVKPNDFKLDEWREILNNKSIRRVLNICFNVFGMMFDSENINHIKNGNIDIISIMFNTVINLSLLGQDKNRINISNMNHEKQKISIISNVFIHKLFSLS